MIFAGRGAVLRSRLWPALGGRHFSAARTASRYVARGTLVGLVVGSSTSTWFLSQAIWGALDDAVGNNKSTWYEFYWLCCKDTALYCWIAMQLQARQAWLQLNGESSDPMETPSLREQLKDRAKSMLFQDVSADVSASLPPSAPVEVDKVTSEKLKAVESQLETLQAALESKDQELSAAKAEDAAASQASSQEQIDELQKEVSIRRKMLEELRGHQIKLLEEVKELKEKLAQQELDLQRSKEVERQRSRELLKVQEDLEQSRQALAGMRTKLEKADADLEKNRAKESQKEREIHQLEKTVHKHKVEIHTLKDKEAATAEEVSKMKKEELELDNTSQFVSYGRRKVLGLWDMILKMKEIDALQRQIREKASLTSDLTTKVAKQTKELVDLKASLDEHVQRASSAAEDLVTARKTLEDKEAEVSTLGAQCVELEAAKAQQLQQISELQSAAAQQQLEGEKLQGQVLLLEAEDDMKSKRISEIQDVLAEKMQDLDVLKMELRQKEEELEDLQQQMSRLRQIDAQKIQQLEELQMKWKRECEETKQRLLSGKLSKVKLDL